MGDERPNARMEAILTSRGEGKSDRHLDLLANTSPHLSVYHFSINIQAWDPAIHALTNN